MGPVQLVPMVRGRLVAVNGVAVDFEAYGDGRARRLAEREFNLSWTDELKADNRLVSGRWWGTVAAEAAPTGGSAASGGATCRSGFSRDRGLPGHRALPASTLAATPTDAEVSVEDGLAKTLGWKLGDRIAWDIAGQRYEAAITSLREVEWESFQPNFFVVARPGSLDGYAASWIGGVHVPPGSRATETLVSRFPNLSVIDIDAVLTQVRATSDQVATAVEAVFGFTLAAGVLVLLAAVVATRDERLLEGGVMRALGASRRAVARRPAGRVRRHRPGRGAGRGDRRQPAVDGDRARGLRPHAALRLARAAGGRRAGHRRGGRLRARRHPARGQRAAGRHPARLRFGLAPGAPRWCIPQCRNDGVRALCETSSQSPDGIAIVLRWILLLVAMVAFGMAFRTDSPGMLAGTLLVGFIALVSGFFGFVAARVGGVAEGQSSREIELLMRARKRDARQGDDGSAALMASGTVGGGRHRDADGNDAGNGGDGGDGGGGGGD